MSWHFLENFMFVFIFSVLNKVRFLHLCVTENLNWTLINKRDLLSDKRRGGRRASCWLIQGLNNFIKGPWYEPLFPRRKTSWAGWLGFYLLGRSFFFSCVLPWPRPQSMHLDWHIWIVYLAGSMVIFQFSPVTQSCPTLYDPMDCSTPGFPAHYQLPELAQTHVHWVSDSIPPSYSLLSPSPPAFNLSQHQGLFQFVPLRRKVTSPCRTQRTDWLPRKSFPIGRKGTKTDERIFCEICLIFGIEQVVSLRS